VLACLLACLLACVAALNVHSSEQQSFERKYRSRSPWYGEIGIYIIMVGGCVRV